MQYLTEHIVYIFVYNVYFIVRSVHCLILICTKPTVCFRSDPTHVQIYRFHLPSLQWACTIFI